MGGETGETGLNMKTSQKQRLVSSTTKKKARAMARGPTFRTFRGRSAGKSPGNPTNRGAVSPPAGPGAKWPRIQSGRLAKTCRLPPAHSVRLARCAPSASRRPLSSTTQSFDADRTSGPKNERETNGVPQASSIGKLQARDWKPRMHLRRTTTSLTILSRSG